MHTFVPNKSFGESIDISQEIFIFLKGFDSGLSYIKVLLTDQNSNHLEIEGKMNNNLVIN